MICEICKKEFKNIKGLSSHIRQTHHILSETYYIQYIDSNNICKICKQPTKFISLSCGFHKYCSYKCANQDLDKIEKQNITFKSKLINIEKARKNIITRNKSIKARQKSSEIGKKTGSQIMTRLHKENDIIKWCNICQKETMHIIGIGCMSCYNKSESHKQSIINTIKEKYGEQYTNVYQVPEIKDKICQVSLEKYNTSNPGNSREARIKASNTMRQNGNYSKDEDFFANELDKLNIKYETQYKSNKYPFYCDFYLIDLDIYIELNIYWSHNNHFFDSTNQYDLITLNIWINKANKGHKQYKNAINVWTKKDILKRNIAQENKLNYVVLWSRQDIKNYINQLKKYINKL